MKSVAAAFIESKDRPASTVAVKTARRICSVCRCTDQETVIEGELDSREEKRIHHSVTVELRYLKSPLDFRPSERIRGWRYRIMQGRPAMERFICRKCMVATREMAREYQGKRDRELGQANHDPYYAALCGE